MTSEIRVGLCGFRMAMGEYARHFPVVEVQSTFYEPASDAVMQRWLATTAPSLEYTMKVWQLVTHPPPVRPIAASSGRPILSMYPAFSGTAVHWPRGGSGRSSARLCCRPRRC